MRGPVAVLCLVGLLASDLTGQGQTLKIVVLKGEDAVNIIQQKTAVAPVVEVRDRNNLPVAGATVVFAINGPGATFGAAQTLTVATNAAGQATAAGLTANAAGAINISATATFQGQTATVTIAQSNVLTAPKSGGSAGKIIGIVGGVAAAGAGVAVAAGSKDDSPTSTTNSPRQTPTGNNPGTPTGGTPTVPIPTTPAPPLNSAPVINNASITPNVALVGAETPIAFQAQASDADNDSISYWWEFPDGSTSEQRAFTRVFQHGGVYTIRINVRDGKTSTSLELTLNMKTMTGVWDYRGTAADPNATGPLREQLDLTQSGSTISGMRHTVLQSITGITVEYHCQLTGTIRATPPQVIIDIPECRTPTGGIYGAGRWEFQADPEINTLDGTGQARNPMTGQVNPSFVTIRRQR